MRFLYTCGILVYTFIIRCASWLGMRKAKLWVKGRSTQRSILTQAFDDHSWVWFHASSLGEFEQGRPLMESFKHHYPNYKILLTFFSPSGYEIRKNYSGADMVLYLPSDTPKNARKFILRFRPKMAFFVKYDFWFNYLHQLKKLNVPHYLVSGIFRPSHYMFKSYGKWALVHLENFDKLFLQDESSHALLKKEGFTNSLVCGDTRFDRVVSVAASGKKFPIVEQFCQQHPILMLGSSWSPDERFIEAALERFPLLKIIIVPHETHDLRIDGIIKNLTSECVRYSDLKDNSPIATRILIINTIGMLSSLYQYATIAHIGNGFGSGIHNTLEAAVFGVPTVFGPQYGRFKEAVDLLKVGGAFSFNTEQEYLNILDSLLNNKEAYKQASDSSRNYVKTNAGATQTILKSLSLTDSFS